MVRAYSEGAKIAVEAGEIITMTNCTTCKVKCDYNFYGKIQPFLSSKDLKIIDTAFTDDVELEIKMKQCDFEKFSEELFDFSNGTVCTVHCFDEFGEYWGVIFAKTLDTDSLAPVIQR